jgi:NAD(P)-dependent dehydrogenase (short-subunit alcohol dehydrogenase family)
MKTILITGGTNGIGLAALKELVKENFFPILICRSKEKAEKTLQILGKGRYYCCELSDLDAVKQCALLLLENEPHIDLFIANAGVIGFDKETLSSCGIEMTIQVNYIAHYLIAETLSELFEKSATRLIFTSSLMHKSKWFANYDFSQGINLTKYSPFKYYARSKACLTTYAVYFASKHPTTSVFLADPGVVGTGIMRSRGKWMNQLFSLAKPFFASEEKGAQPLIHSVHLNKKPDEILYIKGNKRIPFHPKAQDKKIQQVLIFQTEKALETFVKNKKSHEATLKTEILSN